MWSLIAIALTCWVCTLVAAPRRPLPGNEVEELVYARLLGRQQRLLLLALLVTVVAVLAFVVTFPQQINADQQALPARRVCTQPSVGFPTCYEQQANGMWARQEMQSDGTWLTVATVTAPEGTAPP
jgi:hypothetical protein